MTILTLAVLAFALIVPEVELKHFALIISKNLLPDEVQDLLLVVEVDGGDAYHLEVVVRGRLGDRAFGFLLTHNMIKFKACSQVDQHGHILARSFFDLDLVRGDFLDRRGNVAAADEAVLSVKVNMMEHVLVFELEFARKCFFAVDVHEVLRQDLAIE